MFFRSLEKPLNLAMPAKNLTKIQTKFRAPPS